MQPYYYLLSLRAMKKEQKIVPDVEITAMASKGFGIGKVEVKVLPFVPSV